MRGGEREKFELGDNTQRMYVMVLKKRDEAENNDKSMNN